jgi:cysteine synthase
LIEPEPETLGPDLPASERVLPSLVEAAISTPLVELVRCFGDLDGRVLAKLELMGPGGSSGVRVAQRVLKDARQEGRLAAHQTLLVQGAHSLGMVQAGRIFGHPVLVIVGPESPDAALASFELFGADIEIAKDGDFEACAQSMVRLTGGFRVNVDRDLSNFRAHRLGTGPEILHQSRGKVDAFCAHIQSGGTFAGCAAALQEFDPSIRSYTVRLAGLGGELPKVVDPRTVFQNFEIDQAVAREQVQRMARREGIALSLQGGAVIAAARMLLEGPLHGSAITVVLDGVSVAYQAAADAGTDDLCDAA